MNYSQVIFVEQHISFCKAFVSCSQFIQQGKFGAWCLVKFKISVSYTLKIIFQWKLQFPQIWLAHSTIYFSWIWQKNHLSAVSDNKMQLLDTCYRKVE